MLIEFAHIRNMILRNKFDVEEKEMLLTAQKIAVKKNGPFLSLLNACIENCFIDIENRDFAAAREISFIHNLPVEYSDLKKWNENYFYCAELSGYLEENDDFNRIKCHIHEISKAQDNIEKFLKAEGVKI